MTTIALCMAVVCDHFGVTRLDLVSRRRDVRVIFPRQAAMWLARSRTAASFPEIGRMFGRDHTTILHAVAVIERRRACDPTAREELDALALAVDAGILVTETVGVAFRPPQPIDPVAVAGRVLAAGRGATQISVEEVLALADFAISLSERQTRDLVVEAATAFVHDRRRAAAPFSAADAGAAAARHAARKALADLEAAVDQLTMEDRDDDAAAA